MMKLGSKKIIRDYWNFVIKEKNFHFHRFVQYSEFYSILYGEISDLELQYDNFTKIAFGLDEYTNAKNSNLCGIKDFCPLDQTIINYLIDIYMIEKNLFLRKNKIYKKTLDSEFRLIDSIEFLSKNNIIIFEELKKKYPQQLAGLKIPKLFAKGWNLFINSVKKNNHYLFNSF